MWRLGAGSQSSLTSRLFAGLGLSTARAIPARYPLLMVIFGPDWLSVCYDWLGIHSD